MTLVLRRSDIESQNKLVAFIDYSQEILDKLSGSFRMAYEDSTLTSQDVGGLLNEELSNDETMYTLQAHLYTYWPQWGVNGSFTGTYSLFQRELGESTVLSFGSQMTWKIGRTALEMILQYNDFETRWYENNSSQDDMSIRFRMSRELF